MRRTQTRDFSRNALFQTLLTSGNRRTLSIPEVRPATCTCPGPICTDMIEEQTSLPTYRWFERTQTHLMAVLGVCLWDTWSWKTNLRELPHEAWSNLVRWDADGHPISVYWSRTPAEGEKWEPEPSKLKRTTELMRLMRENHVTVVGLAAATRRNPGYVVMALRNGPTAWFYEISRRYFEDGCPDFSPHTCPVFTTGARPMPENTAPYWLSESE